MDLVLVGEGLDQPLLKTYTMATCIHGAGLAVVLS